MRLSLQLFVEWLEKNFIFANINHCDIVRTLKDIPVSHSSLAPDQENMHKHCFQCVTSRLFLESKVNYAKIKYIKPTS